MHSAPTIGFTTEDLARLAACRAQRSRLLVRVRDGEVAVGDLPRVVDSAFLGATRLVKVLEVHPSLGKVAARRLVSDLGLGEQTTLAGVGPDDWRSLAARIGIPGGVAR